MFEMGVPRAGPGVEFQNILLSFGSLIVDMIAARGEKIAKNISVENVKEMGYRFGRFFGQQINDLIAASMPRRGS